MVFALLFLVFCILVAVMVSGLSAAVWVPAFSKDTDVVIKKLQLKKGLKVMEFGCGDGRFLRKAANHGAMAIGYEINPFIVLIAWFLNRGKNVQVRWANAWKKSFSSADVVFVFIMPKVMERLGTKLKKELKPGSLIVTYAYPIPNTKHYHLENNCYFYRI